MNRSKKNIMKLAYGRVSNRYPSVCDILSQLVSQKIFMSQKLLSKVFKALFPAQKTATKCVITASAGQTYH